MPLGRYESEHPFSAKHFAQNQSLPGWYFSSDFKSCQCVCERGLTPKRKKCLENPLLLGAWLGWRRKEPKLLSNSQADCIILLHFNLPLRYGRSGLCRFCLIAFVFMWLSVQQSGSEIFFFLASDLK